MSNALMPVAVDIETTGWAIDDVVTVVGLRLPLGSLLLLNVDGREINEQDLSKRVEASSESNLILRCFDGEKQMLAHLTTEIEERVADDDKMLVAYNGETWSGGFDLPFLRGRYGRLDIDWAFRGVPYADIMTVYQKRVNTTDSEGDEQKSLEGVYDTVISEPHCDPFESSESAVSAWKDGEFESLLLHNLADIERTQELAEWAQRLVPVSDWQLKDMTPPVR